MRTTLPIRTIYGRVNGDGSIASGTEFIVQRTSTGVYQITFTGGLRLRGMTVSSANASTWGFVAADQFTGNGCRVICVNSAASVGIDNPFSFTATVTS